MRPSYLTIRAPVIHQIRSYCLSQLPFEGCGILAGPACEITHFFPIPSQNNCPCAFEFEPKVYLDTLKQMRTDRLYWLGVVHSHPFIAATPTPKDLATWHDPDRSFWILSFKDAQVQLCAYYIEKNKAIPMIYQIVE
jgi:[CysO sulfur-carrier protein]-S-L-cysteine hydrolase